jgi:hypothetical protein
MPVTKFGLLYKIGLKRIIRLLFGIQTSFSFTGVLNIYFAQSSYQLK